MITAGLLRFSRRHVTLLEMDDRRIVVIGEATGRADYLDVVDAGVGEHSRRRLGTRHPAGCTDFRVLLERRLGSEACKKRQRKSRPYEKKIDGIEDH